MTSPEGLSTTLAVQWWFPGVIDAEEKIAPTFSDCWEAVSTCDRPVAVIGRLPVLAPGEALGRAVPVGAAVAPDPLGEGEILAAVAFVLGEPVAEALPETAAVGVAAGSVEALAAVSVLRPTPTPMPPNSRPAASIAPARRRDPFCAAMGSPFARRRFRSQRI
jgi:hypothetical protein